MTVSSGEGQSRLIVDLSAIANNLKAVREFAGDTVGIMGVVKAAGYGTHLDRQVAFLQKCGLDRLAVALLEEGIGLRENGFGGDILVLNPVLDEQVPAAIDYNLTLNGCRLETLRLLNLHSGGPVRVHIEIETGMGRAGVGLDDLTHFISGLGSLKKIQIEGLFSHLSSSSKHPEYSLEQLRRFDESVRIFRQSGIEPKFKHVLSSGGIIQMRTGLYNVARIGILLYGHLPPGLKQARLNLIPCTKLTARINFVKTVKAGTAIGYNRAYVSNREQTIATIPFGFADGLSSLEPGRSYFIVNGKPAPLLAICMDSMMLDVSGIDGAEIGTRVYLWDNENLTVETVAEWCHGLCVYEILSSISNRVQRYFVGSAQA